MTRDRKIRRGAGLMARGRADLALHQLEDGRGKKGRRWKVAAPLWTMMLMGMVTGRKSLADTERMSDDISPALRRRLDIRRRTPDTTMRSLVMKTPLSTLRSRLRRQTWLAHKRKALDPRKNGLPCGVVALDGKTVTTKMGTDGRTGLKKGETSTPNPFAQKQGGLYHLRTFTSTLISAPAAICVDMEPIPAKTNEMGHFPVAFRNLVKAYGGIELFEVATADAGNTSKGNAELVAEAGYGYLFGLKDNQPELLNEAHRLLAHRSADEADAKTSERARGMITTRRLWLTTEMAGYHDWKSLKTVLRVESETKNTAGNTVERESRFFLSNVHIGRFKPPQWLAVVRAHWRVENDCHHTWDKAFEEDDHPWMWAPHGILALQILRRVAYNLMVLFRNVSLRDERKGFLPWRELLDWLLLVAYAADERHLADLRWDPRRAPT